MEYNAIGQLVLDEKNSEIRKMEYDVSGKVKRVLDGADQEITAFAYDDRGFRILKRTGAREEWYVRDASGNIMSIYHRDTTSNSLAQIELPIYGSGKLGNAFRQPDHLNYNYELTDHLGNVRATFSNVHTLAVASMEPDNNAWEEQYFDNLSTRHSDPLLAQESYYSARLRPTTPVGPTITLEVKEGATIHLNVGGRYIIPQGGFNPANLTGGIGNLLNGAFDGSVVAEGGTLAPANVVADAFAALSGAPWEEETTPKAYIQYLLFDTNWTLMDSDEVYLPAGASSQYEQMSLPDIAVANDGYLYAYLVNESEIDVHFDNLTVSVLGLNVLSTRNYYPYGSVAYEWKNPDFDDRYRFGYQGQFAEEDTVTGWNHFDVREWDSKIARWTAIDPALQYWSPYMGMGNDPLNQVDPDGAYSKAGAWWRSAFGLINPIYQSGTTLDGKEIWGFNGKDGAANFGKEHTRDGVQTLQEWNPSLMQQWSMNDNLFSKLAYSSVDDMYVTGQMVLLQHQRSHLDGQPVVGEESGEAFVGFLADRIPYSRLAKGAKGVKLMSASEFSSKFKGTYFARMKPLLRGVTNTYINKKTLELHAGKPMIEFVSALNEAQKQSIIEFTQE